MRSADILGRCASTATLSRTRASTSGSASGVVTGLRVGVGVNALQEFVTVNGLLTSVTDGSLRLPECSLVKGTTKVCATKQSWIWWSCVSGNRRRKMEVDLRNRQRLE